MLEKLRKHQFLFEELVKRDFKKKYKRTVLGMRFNICFDRYFKYRKEGF